MYWIEKYWNVDAEVQLKILFSILVFVGLWLIRFFLNRLLFNRVKDVKERYYWKNGIRNTQYALVIIIIGAIWVDRIGSVATFLGLVTAGLAIALQDPIVNLAGWLFIVIRRPFEMGDRIQVGEFAGDVIDIRFFQFTLNEINNWVDADQSTGRIIHIPNGKVFKEPQASYTQGFSHIWNEINIVITFESDWQKAKAILKDIVKDHAEHLTKAAQKRLVEASKQFMIFYKNLTPTVYTEVKENGVQISMRYLVLPRRRRLSEHRIWEDVLKEFNKHNEIEFAYPTQRIFFKPQEGRPNAGSGESSDL